MDRIRKLEDENIIIVTNNVEITSEVVDYNRNMCRELMADMQGSVVIIVDYREAKTSFGDIVEIMKGNQSGKRKDINQRAFTIFVGQDSLISMYRDSMRLENSGAVTIPYYSDMETALEVARLHLADKNAQVTP